MLLDRCCFWSYSVKFFRQLEREWENAQTSHENFPRDVLLTPLTNANMTKIVPRIISRNVARLAVARFVSIQVTLP